MTDVEIEIVVNKFKAFAASFWLMHQEADPGIFCRCRLAPDSPDCKRRRMQGRLLRRQQRPCGRPLAPQGSRARRAHAAAGAHGAGGGDSGSSDDGGGGGPDPRCNICGLACCQTLTFCRVNRALDALRNAQC